MRAETSADRFLHQLTGEVILRVTDAWKKYRRNTEVGDSSTDGDISRMIDHELIDYLVFVS